jgi:Ala-tRNA(Pro) deacylase
MVVLPACCRVDTTALARALGEREVAFVSEVDLASLFPDCETGAMPPFGELYGLPVWVDACFGKEGPFAFQAGNHHELVRIRYEEFERLVQPKVAEFCLH